jgi:hypothetical protein
MMWILLILAALVIFFVVGIFCPPLFGIERVWYLMWLEKHKAWRATEEERRRQERQEAWERGECLDNWRPPPLTGKAAADRAARKEVDGR